MSRFSTIGILAPTLHRYEGRAPLTPGAVSELVKMGIPVYVQLSPIRVFPAQAYRDAGATVRAELGDLAQVVFGVKQIPTDVFREGIPYYFFSRHVF